MNITLEERTAETVAIYFRKADTPLIRKTLPQKAKTLEGAIADYKATLLPGATSYGRTIWADGVYVGDIWCYGIHSENTPNAMIRNCFLSYCIFETGYWNKGLATEALRLFMQEIIPKYDLNTIGAFTYTDNLPSIKVLEKNHFVMVEEFMEKGISSKYFEYHR
ncbi:MAG: GNAT family N-acetyltransferase [Lachnospiraceae bacterium]